MNCSTHPEKEAILYCKDCEKFLCDQCKVTHNAVYEGEHVLSHVEPASTCTIPADNCPDHPKNKLDLFCNDCHGNHRMPLTLAHSLCNFFLYS